MTDLTQNSYMLYEQLGEDSYNPGSSDITTEYTHIETIGKVGILAHHL